MPLRRVELRRGPRGQDPDGNRRDGRALHRGCVRFIPLALLTWLTALGIENEVKELGLRGAKKKNGKKVEEVDFTPILKPIALDEVDKVAAAVRQATPTRRILEKLLQRIVVRRSCSSCEC